MLTQPQPYLRCLQAVEKPIFEEHTMLNLQLRYLLECPGNFDSNSKPTSKTMETLFALMFSYRLVDLFAHHAAVGGSRSLVVPKNPSLPTSVKLEVSPLMQSDSVDLITVPKHWKHLEDMSKLITVAQRHIGNLLSNIPTPTPAFTAPTNLIKQLVDIESKKIGIKILQNVILAALALAWIRSAPFQQTMGSMQRVIKDSDLQLPDSTDVIISPDAYVLCETLGLPLIFVSHQGRSCRTRISSDCGTR